ncbi:hypothetical protein DFH09DRAFT_1299558 [Mycena vulgaris]|nr:hypothetical protein DFH09DRAFT_1299558 [Mycena vulgaris]
MFRRLGIPDLLNAEETVDVRDEIRALREMLLTFDDGEVLVLPTVQRHLRAALVSLGRVPVPPRIGPAPTPDPTPDPEPAPAPAPNPHPQPQPQPPTITQEHGVKLNRKTTLSTLYRYPLGLSVEYPETATPNPVGHPFRLDLDQWYNPWLDFAYSLGNGGGAKVTDITSCPLLVDETTGEEVPCKKQSLACQGIKACPLADLEQLQEPHTCATREAIRQRLANEREARSDWSSPQRDLFMKTSAYITAINQVGCRRRETEVTFRAGAELEAFEAKQALHKAFRRGYSAPQAPCQGRIVFHDFPEDAEHHGLHRGPYLSCEHYSSRNHHHWVDFSIADGQYDLEYITAIFTNDGEEASRIEEAAAQQEHGPRAICTIVTNVSNQRLNCPLDHCEGSQLVQKPMQRLECSVVYQMWVPLETYRSQCPYILVTSKGAHQHAIPLPEKTPRPVRAQILKLLKNLCEDLPDMTPRRFLRHSVVKAFLYERFPDHQCPTLSTLHCSLTNKSHIGSYISRAKKEHFPQGTDWEGVLHLKVLQDEQLPEEEHYIRAVLELDDDSLPSHDEDEPPGPEKKTRIIVCMAREGSERLQKKGAYIQSDIGFKRIVGFDEFEMASMDREANTSVIFCRVYVTRHTAAAHHRIFKEIQRIVKEDTGFDLHWRHLHASDVSEFDGMILHWAADQHRGQAKGLGLHLVELAQKLPLNRMDLHEPHRPLRDLGPYDHLRRLFRVCVVHNYRNIKSCPVPEPVRQLMRSLACISHPDWDGTLVKIRAEGGKAAQDWVRDKETCQFAFPGLCHEKSFIPIAIWKAGEPNSNLIESVHSDVNREGVHCTLVGGLLKGRQFDTLKFQTLKHWEDFGMRPTNQPVSSVVNAVKNMKRKNHTQAKRVEADDLRVQQHNEAMTECHTALEAALQNVQRLERIVQHNPDISQGGPLARAQLAAARVTASTAQSKHEQQIQVGKALRASRAHGVLLPGAAS